MIIAGFPYQQVRLLLGTLFQDNSESALESYERLLLWATVDLSLLLLWNLVR
jgi:hypothetical protein